MRLIYTESERRKLETVSKGKNPKTLSEFTPCSAWLSDLFKKLPIFSR